MKKKIPCAAALSYDINWIKLDEDMPLYEIAEKYLCVKISCLTSRRVDHNLQQELAEATAYLTAVQGAALFEHASAGEPEAMLEMAVRYLSGCGTRKASNEGALYVLDALVDPSCELAKARGLGVICRALMAQAHSCAAQAHLNKFMASPAERAATEADERSYSRPETLRLGVGRSPLEYFLLAAHHANESVKLGLDSPIVLSVGMKIRQMGEVLGVDVQLTVKRGKLFRPLWCAVSRRYEELYEEERSRARKTNRNPNEYVCAAEGCGIGGERRAALLECSGRCPRDLKPHYCSKQCQKRDWPMHKPICKPKWANSGGKALEISEQDKAKALMLFELRSPADEIDNEAEVIEEINTENLNAGRRGRRHVVHIPVSGAPGGSVRITSNTLDSESLRSLRDAASKLSM